MTSKLLTKEDLVWFHVTLNTAEGSSSRVLLAAYIASEPDWLLLKDHNHQIVAQFHHDRVVSVVRGDKPE